VLPAAVLQQRRRAAPAMEPHPFGVAPLGNCYASCGASGVADAVAAGASGDPVRTGGLGALGRLSDELLLALLGALPPAALAALCCASRACRAFAAADELWRAATLDAFGGDVRFVRTWRETYRRAQRAHAAAAHPHASTRTHAAHKSHAAAPPFPRRRLLREEPSAGAPDEVAPCVERVRAVGLCSDVLFQAHLCAATPLKPHWLARDTVPRVSGLSPAQFAERFERHVLRSYAHAHLRIRASARTHTHSQHARPRKPSSSPAGGSPCLPFSLSFLSLPQAQHAVHPDGRCAHLGRVISVGRGLPFVGAWRRNRVRGRLPVCAARLHALRALRHARRRAPLPVRLRCALRCVGASRPQPR
jgi:hypothetical protein